ncbi:MAG: peptidylprolyl isomerase [Xanthomonadales bacterium]|nr:peptidylprolyl isomerase [Xanthomonadales bacterium]NIX13839.1 peptidylprolyl isomerase [Xanthomonadales bacterium]
MNRPLRALILAAALAGGGTVTAQEDMLWREVDPGNTVNMELDVGTVIIELNPVFAPGTVEQFKRLVGEGFYRGLSFYRVIDGFVAQGGDESDVGLENSQPALPAEFERRWDEKLAWTRVEARDMFEAETGFIDGFAAGRERDSVWLLHCPGVVAMARGDEPDSGSTDFYIVIGQSPRYLDRNLTVFGRVVHGMDAVQRIRRGPVDANGIIERDTDRSRILNMSLGHAMTGEEKRTVYVMDTNSNGFSDYMKARRNRSDDFFHHRPPRVLDACQVPVGTRLEKPPSGNRPPTR